MNNFKKYFISGVATMLTLSAISFSAFASGDDIVATYKNAENEDAVVYESDMENGSVTVTAFDGGTITIGTSDEQPMISTRAASANFIASFPSSSPSNAIVMSGSSIRLNYNVVKPKIVYSPNMYVAMSGRKLMKFTFTADSNYGGLVKKIVYKNGSEYIKVNMDAGNYIQVSGLTTNDFLCAGVQNLLYTSAASGSCTVN